MRPLNDMPPHGHRASEGAGPTAPQPPNMIFTRPMDESAMNDALRRPISSLVPSTRDAQKQHASQPTESPPCGPPRRAAEHHLHSDLPGASSDAAVLDSEDENDDDFWMSRPTSQRSSSPGRTADLLSTRSPSPASSSKEPVGKSIPEETDGQHLSATESRKGLLLSTDDKNSTLVVPSIKLPDRRPFTEEGKRIGRLKVLLAGGPGVGKTSLIQALATTAEAIVHIDQSAPPSVRGPPSTHSANDIVEILASTKPMPEWWPDLNDSRVNSRRRDSLGDDIILDRNVCFIDTPGYSCDPSVTNLKSMENTVPTVRYIESLFERVAANGSTDPDMLSMLGGNGGNQVDVVLYLIKTELSPADLKYLQLLAPLTNVIPVIAQADTMTPDGIVQFKLRIRSELERAKISPFFFKHGPDWPYAVSTTLRGSYFETMDASILMSPDYVPPLVPSELADLAGQIFCENGAAWLKDAAAYKYLHWKRSENSRGPRVMPRPFTEAAGQQTTTTLIGTAPQPYNREGLAAIENQEHQRLARNERLARNQRLAHNQRLARIRHGNWASELDSSMRRERAQSEATAREQRNSWLFEKECEDDREFERIDALEEVAVRDMAHRASDMSEKRQCARSYNLGATSTTPLQDPLGLVQSTVDIMAKTWTLVQVVSGVGLFGGIVFWAAKQDWSTQAIGWASENWAAAIWSVSSDS